MRNSNFLSKIKNNNYNLFIMNFCEFSAKKLFETSFWKKKFKYQVRQILWILGVQVVGT